MVMVNEEGQHWGEISHWRISHALRYWFGWALAIVGQVGWVSAILRFEWWAWRYGSLCVVFFLQFPFGLVLPMDPEICSQFVCGMAEACRMPECFTTCCRYVSINGNVLVKATNRPWDSLYVHQMQVHRRPAAPCQEKWPGVGVDAGAQ